MEASKLKFCEIYDGVIFDNRIVPNFDEYNVVTFKTNTLISPVWGVWKHTRISGVLQQGTHWELGLIASIQAVSALMPPVWIDFILSILTIARI